MFKAFNFQRIIDLWQLTSRKRHINNSSNNLFLCVKEIYFVFFKKKKSTSINQPHTCVTLPLAPLAFGALAALPELFGAAFDCDDDADLLSLVAVANDLAPTQKLF
jgi:hypothetical protein